MNASFKQGESHANVSCDNGMQELTIRGSLKDKEKLCDFVYMVDSTDGTRRNKITAGDPQLDNAVFTWFVKERQSGPTVFLVILEHVKAGYITCISTNLN